MSFIRTFAAIIIAIVFSACSVESPYSVQLPSNGKSYIGLHGEPSPNPSTLPTLPEFITLNTNTSLANLKVYLNGYPISSHFSLSGSTAQASFSAVSDLLRQGVNTLTINPENFGPLIRFNFDNKGPTAVLSSINCLDGDCTDINGGMVEITVEVDEPSVVQSMTLETKSYNWNSGVDNTQYRPFKKESIVAGTVYPMGDNGDGTFSVSVPESTLYSFVATDEHGYSTTTEFLSEGQYLNNVFKLRIGKSLLDSVIPIVEPQIDGSHFYSEQAVADYNYSVPAEALPNAVFDSMNRWWSSQALFYSEIGASTTNENDCGFMDVETLNNADFYCSNVKTDKKTSSKKYCLAQDLRPISSAVAKPGSCTRIVIWRLQLDDARDMTFTLNDTKNGRVDLDMTIAKQNLPKALYTDLGMRNIECKARYTTQSYCKTTLFGGCISSEDGIAWPLSETRTHTPKDFCRDIGGATAILGTVQLGDLKVTADRAQPEGVIDAVVHNGDLELAINSSNFSLNLQGLSVNIGLFSGFVGILEGLLDGLFVDIVGNVIKQNLTDFTLRFDLFSETGSQMTLVSDAQQVFTNADNNAATPVEWYMYYSGFLDASVPHPDVPDALGSLFFANEVLVPADNPSIADDNFSIALNTNIINQALTAIYRAGLMHFTILSQAGSAAEIFFEPNATQDFTGVANKSLRVELFPHSPATFEMNERSDGSQATLRYWGAEMNVDVYNSATASWENRFTAVADIKAGVLLNVVDKQVRMTIEGTPQITLRNISDFTVIGGSNDNGFALSIGGSLMEKTVLTLLEYAIPQVAESFLNIDVPDITEPNTGLKVITTTETIDVNNGKHLGFSMGLNLE